MQIHRYIDSGAGGLVFQARAVDDSTLLSAVKFFLPGRDEDAKKERDILERFRVKTHDATNLEKNRISQSHLLQLLPLVLAN